MSDPAVRDGVCTWSECRDCGLVQGSPPLADGEAAYCCRCSALIRRAARDSLGFACANAVTGSLLFALALTYPLVSLHLFGRLSTSTLFSGPDNLRSHGMPGLAVVVLLTLIVIPPLKLALELAVLFGARVRRPPPWLPWLFGWLELVSPWAMIEVFLLGSFVAYTRLQAIGRVDVGPALWAFAGVMVSMVATDATLDREAVWQTLSAKVAHRGRPSAHTPESVEGPDSDEEERIGCHTCGLFTRCAEGDRCPRCRHRLRARKPDSVHRTWALLLAALLLYIPANVLPVMTVTRFARGEPTTILHGVVQLARDKLWPLAIIVLLASIVIPIVKVASLFTMLVMTHRRSAAWLHARTRLFRFVRWIGRWSMIDVFVLAILAGVVRLESITTVLPKIGASAFCAVVVTTMLATEAFDPRLMWDAGVPSVARGRPREARS
jgi:paraquat-inducible protein A